MMKHIFYTAALSLIFLSGVFAKTPNYKGIWMLDINASKNLPGYYANVNNHKISVKQNKKSFNVGVEIELKEGAKEKFNFLYNLDGSETKTESQIHMQNGLVNVPTVLKASEINNKMQITISREIQLNGEKITAVTTEIWDLSADGKTLTIHRTDDTPRGILQMDMVFIKN